METPSLSVLQPRFQETSALISVTIRDARVDDMERKVLEGNHGSRHKRVLPSRGQRSTCAFGRMTVAG